MPDFEAIEVLTQAKERLFEHGWRKGPWVCGSGPMCVEEAIVGIHGRFLYENGDAKSRAEGFLRQHTGRNEWIWKWNDDQDSATPIFAALDEAILLAKDAPTPETGN